MNQPTAPRVMAPSAVADLVKLHRAFYGWKRATLAALARVSLSTVERVERGESVRRSSLENIALALNQPRDAFTAARVPLSEAEACAMLVEHFAWIHDTVAVDVAPLRHEAQLRALTDTDVVVVASDLEGEEAAQAVQELREYLDLTGFLRAEDGTRLPKRERSFGLRRFYKEVLDVTRNIERRHKAVCLAGTYEAKSSTPNFDTVRVAVVAVRSRERNPAAARIKRLLGEDTIDMRAAMEACFEGVG